ncbi:MAG TPA: response regulator [Chloroflexia bacterium]|nr:response regulator [Chloroflexia bacterium]
MSKILIVDDEPTIVDLLEEHLQSEGYDTTHAFSGEEALQVLDDVTPDLVILDLMLPGMDGYEVCRLMQLNPRLNHIPVIMVTARSAIPNKVMGYQRGADDYVVKPFDPEELSVRVRAQLHHLYHDTVAELTGLPGPQVIEETIQSRTQDSSRPWAIIYIDITNFTAYNESYTFLEGDDMIKEAADALDQAVRQEGEGDDLVGHMGGDKFVVITEPPRVEAITACAQELFAKGRDNLYSPVEREQGFVATVNHQGLLAHVALCALDFEVVTSEEG